MVLRPSLEAGGPGLGSSLARALRSKSFLFKTLYFPRVSKSAARIQVRIDGRVRDLLGQRRGLEDPRVGRRTWPVGAARQEDSLLELQMQLGSLQYPRNPMKGASEHFHFLLALAGGPGSAPPALVFFVGCRAMFLWPRFPVPAVGSLSIFAIETLLALHGAELPSWWDVLQLS